MLNAWIADIILVVHFFFILFVLFGAFLVLLRGWIRWLHLLALSWASIVSLAGWVCPLTPLENYYRHLAGQAVYQTSFIEQYLLPVIYPDDLGRGLQIAMGVFVVLWNGVLYFFLLKRSAR